MTAAKEVGTMSGLCAMLRFALLLGVGDARVINGFQALGQHTLGLADVAERDGTPLEVAGLHLPVDYPVHKFLDVLFGKLLQRTRRSLHGVAHHEDCLFARKGWVRDR